MANTCEILERWSDWADLAFPEPAPVRARDAALYRAHVEEGASLRALARETGRHPSTVLRAVRRVEARRDDPLFDRLIEAAPPSAASGGPTETKSALPPARAAAAPAAAGEAGPGRRARIALRRLAEPGAFLLIAEGAEKGGIFCAANAHAKPIALLPVQIAAEMLRADWIRAARRGPAAVRYTITEAGRAALKRHLAEREGAAGQPGLAEAQAPFRAQHAAPGARALADAETGERRAIAVDLAESPLAWLSRRKGADGRPFLAPEEAEAGERLRADFEAAQMGPRVTQDWAAFLTPCDRGRAGPGRGPAEGPRAARERVTAALSSLGPGLADAALRVCCFLEGLESCEKRMGWSARSGKVVLKIALQRLAAHYGLDR